MGAHRYITRKILLAEYIRRVLSNWSPVLCKLSAGSEAGKLVIITVRSETQHFLSLQVGALRRVAIIGFDVIVMSVLCVLFYCVFADAV